VFSIGAGLAAVMANGGCGGDALPGSLPLTQPVAVSALRVDDASRLSAMATGGLLREPNPLDLRVDDVKLTAVTGPHARLDALELPLDDVDVTAAMVPPKGLRLSNIALRLGRPVAATVIHAQDDAVELEAITPLTVDWSLVLDDGRLYKLGPQPTQPLTLIVDVVRGASGDAVATVEARCPGTCFAVEGLVELHDGKLHVAADALISPLN
jgi:hypothetical protein